MTEHDIASLQEELNEFQTEKDKIRRVVGQIGGKPRVKRDKIINALFIIIIVILLSIDILRHILGLSIPFPPVFLIELSVLLVSIKIVWMIHKQSKVEHFHFWILNAIEFRLNNIAKRIRKIEKKLESPVRNDDGTGQG